MATSSQTIANNDPSNVGPKNLQNDAADSRTNSTISSIPLPLNQSPITMEKLNQFRRDLAARDLKIPDGAKSAINGVKQFTDVTGASSLEWKNSLRVFSILSDKIAFKAKFSSSFTSLTQNYFYWSNKTIDHYHPFATSYRYIFRPHFELLAEGAEELSPMFLGLFPSSKSLSASTVVSMRQAAIFTSWCALAAFSDSTKLLKALGLL